MRTASLVFGSLGGIAAVLGGLTVGGVISLHPELTWMFWFVLSAVLLLSSIAFGIHRDQGE